MGVGTTNHVSIGGHEYLIKPYSYSQRKAPEFGARFATGDPDFNNLSLWQHWAQRCWIGGVGQDLFQDDAMYDEGVGVDTSEHERVTLCRDMARGSGSNWTISSGTANAASFRTIIYNSTLYVLGMPDLGSEGHLWKYDAGTDGWTRITSLDGQNITPRSIATFDGKLFIAGVAVGTSTPKIIYGSGALASWTVKANPAGVPAGAIYSMRAFQQKLYVAFRTSVWRLKDDQNWDGNTVFYKADMNSDSNYIVAMETHLGFLYMLSQNGHVHRTDGNSTFDIWSWDGQTYGIAIRSFDGRLFILTFEFTNTADVGFGVLYQMSGSAVTMLKRWGDENAATIIGNMTVFDRKLFYGASNLLGFGNRAGFGVAVYDPVEDAHSIMAANEDTTTYPRGVSPYRGHIVDDQIFFGGYLFAFVRGHGAFKTPYKPNDRRTALRRFDVTPAGASATSLNGGWFTTSTYDAGTPGVKKLWRKIALDVTIKANTSIVAEYSTNNGTSYTALTAVTTVQTRSRVEFWLNNVIATSIKLRFTLRSTSGVVSPELWGFVVSYIPVPEPNWMWTMTLVLSEKQELLDGSTRVMDTEAEIAFLKGLHRTKQLIDFIDIDGTAWATNGPGAMIYDIDVRVGQMTQPLEGEVVLTLIEAVETY